MSPRLLLLSGVGPFARHDEIFFDGFSVPFHIDNPGIGTGLFDHVAALLAYQDVSSPAEYTAYHYSDYTANAADLTRYAGLRAGPYAQYGPVSVMHQKIRRRERSPDVEVFINPFGAGAAGGPYNGARHFSAFAMLLRPEARAVMKIDRDGFVTYPQIYLTNERDAELIATAIQQLIFMYRDNSDWVLTFGPGGSSHPHLDPDRFDDVLAYVRGFDPVDGVFYTRGSSGFRVGARGGHTPRGTSARPCRH